MGLKQHKEGGLEDTITWLGHDSQGSDDDVRLMFNCGWESECMVGKGKGIGH